MIVDDKEGAPPKSADLLRENEVAEGIMVIIDDRFVVLFPMEWRAQVEHLVETVNLAHRQRLAART
jgi:hypothetical protein